MDNNHGASSAVTTGDQRAEPVAEKRRPLIGADDVNKWHRAAMRALGNNELRRKWGVIVAGSPVTVMLLCEDISRLQIERSEMLAALQQAESYFDNHADVVDGSYGNPEPNAAMTVLTEIRAAIAKATGGT